MKKVRYYESFSKNEKGKWYFLGWYPMLNEKFCTDTKKIGKYIYKTYKHLDGTVEEYRYGAYEEKEVD